MSIRNVELQTAQKMVTSDTSAVVIGGQVPAGMTRWVTFMTVDNASNTDTEAVRLYLASVPTAVPTMASIVATTNRKMLFNLRASKVAGIVRGGLPFQVPDQPNVDKPLFSIGSEKYLGAFGSDLTANVFIQYFDE